MGDKCKHKGFFSGTVQNVHIREVWFIQLCDDIFAFWRPLKSLQWSGKLTNFPLPFLYLICWNCYQFFHWLPQTKNKVFREESAIPFLGRITAGYRGTVRQWRSCSCHVVCSKPRMDHPASSPRVPDSRGERIKRETRVRGQHVRQRTAAAVSSPEKAGENDVMTSGLR